MAAPTRSLAYRFKYSGIQNSLNMTVGTVPIRKSVIFTIVCIVLTFMGALYYVKQQVRLQSLNYEIIELKAQKKALNEQHKTFLLQLHQLKRLDSIEQDMRKAGFVPAEETQIRIIH